MKRLIAAVLAAAVAGGLWACSRSGSGGRGRSGQTIEAQYGKIEQTVDATGSVLPLNRVEIKPPISGRVEKLLVDEGDHVKSGQILAWMSSTDRAAILDAARAQGPDELKKWEDSYKPTPIVSSLTGEVILRNVVVGQTVDPSTVLYALADTLITYAEVDESDIGKVRIGQKARIVLDAYPDRPVEGTVFDILYEGKNVSNVITYGVKIRPDKVPPFFRSQMTANVSFEVSHKERALILPAYAVRTQPDGSRTVLLPPAGGSDAKPERREIKVGIENDDSVEVLSGLDEGEKVLVSQGRYVPQKAPESSPLSFNRPKRSGDSGKAPKPKK
jgi:macrolide-specific efflux system membrane fusion protein